MGSCSKGTVAREGTNPLLETFRQGAGSSEIKISRFFGEVAIFAWETFYSSCGIGVGYFELWFDKEFFCNAYFGISGIK